MRRHKHPPVKYSAITKNSESISCVANWSQSNSRHPMQTDHKTASCQILTDYKWFTMMCGSALWSRSRRWSCPCASQESRGVRDLLLLERPGLEQSILTWPWNRQHVKVLTQETCRRHELLPFSVLFSAYQSANIPPPTTLQQRLPPAARQSLWQRQSTRECEIPSLLYVPSKRISSRE